MVVNDSRGVEFDLLQLKIGTPIQIEIAQEDVKNILRTGPGGDKVSDGDRVAYLVKRGYPKKVAEDLIQAVSKGTGKLRPTFYTREVVLDMSEQGFSCRIGFVNYIQLGEINRWKVGVWMNKSVIGNIGLYREIFKDDRDFLRVVRIEKVEVATDGSGTRMLCETVIDSLECFIALSFDPALQSPPEKGDLWLAGFINGNLNQGIAIQRIYNLPDPAHPKTVMEGHTVLSSRVKKKVMISNDHKAEMTENAVLGPELVKWLLELTEEVKGIADKVNTLSSNLNSHIHQVTSIGAPSGPAGVLLGGVSVPLATSVTTAPEKASIEQIEADTETDKFLSDLMFIQEKQLDNSPDQS